MKPIKHPILYQKYSLSEHTKKESNSNAGYVDFPEGRFKTLNDVKLAEPAKYINMKDQFLIDIDKLKSLSQRLVGTVYDNEIASFRWEISNDLQDDAGKASSLISFRDTRYYLHSIVKQVESFLELEARGEADKASVNRDGLCTLFHECLSGIEHCIEGSSSRIQSAFVSLEGSQSSPHEVLFKIKHRLLEYGIKSFLARERAKGRAEYDERNEVHWYNALYNVACERFGLEPIFDQYATLGDNAATITKLERTLPSLMPECELFSKISETFYQELVRSFKKIDKESWLTGSVSSSELTYDTTMALGEDFIGPMNLRFKVKKNENEIGLGTISKACEDGSYDFSKSRERLQVWLIDSFLNPSSTESVIATPGKKNKAPQFYIGSKDDLYFWAFESGNPLKQGEKCTLDWDNHHTLTLGRLKGVDFYHLPKDLRFNLLYHAINQSHKPGDFFEFFLNKNLSKNWDATVKSDHRIKEVMLEKLVQVMSSDEVIARELTDKLNSLSKKYHHRHFFNDLFYHALKMEQVDVIACLLQAGLCKDLPKDSKAEYKKLLFSTLKSDLKKFKTLWKYPLIDINTKNKNNETLLTTAASNGQTDGLKLLLAQKEIDVNKRDGNGNTALILAAKKGQTECLKELLKQAGIKLNEENNYGVTAFLGAALYGQTECLKALLVQKGIKTNMCRKEDGVTALMGAARYGHGGCLEALLAHDPSSINAQMNDGCTALMLAAKWANENCASLLLRQPGIDVNKKNKEGDTAWDCAKSGNRERQRPWQSFQQVRDAASNGNVALLTEQLNYASALIHTRDESGLTLAMLAAENGHQDCLKEILAKKAINVNDQDKNGNTALMLAAKNGHAECVKALLAQDGIDVNKQDNNGDTALMLAADSKQTECLKELLVHPDTNISKRAKSGETALMLAAKMGKWSG